jgi:AcrR family transcriptional regulator
MVRTAGSDGARTEIAIRKAAIDLIAAKGFEAVTLRGLAKQIGLQAGSLYRYYSSKNELLNTIIITHMEDVLAAWDASKPDTDDPSINLAAFVEFHVQYHATKPKEVFIANMELRSLISPEREIVIELRRRYENILHAILKSGVEKGMFNLPDVKVATFAILAMLTGLTAWYQEGGRLTKEELVACYSQLVFTGVEKPNA